MIDIKNENEIQIMRDGGKILADVVCKTLEKARPGISELELDSFAEKMIIDRGGEPGFKKVPGYHHTLCVSVNDVVVHGVPSDYVLKDGDILGVDCGVFYKGLNTDMSESIIVGNSNDPKKVKFLETGKRALSLAIDAALPGKRIGDISLAIQSTVEAGGYSVVRSLIGHGVGKELHEDPEVPGYLDDEIINTLLLKPGMTIAIEAIYNMGGFDVVYGGDDGWTIKTADGSISGLFERSVVITKTGNEVLTK